MGWMKYNLRHGAVFQRNWIGIPGILYDHNNVVIDTISDFSTYIEYLSLPIDLFVWFNQCDEAVKTYGTIPFHPWWSGDNFNIFPGQGIEISVTSDCVLPLKFGQGYKRHLICNDGVDDFYCEWLGQEEFDPLEG